MAPTAAERGAQVRQRLLRAAAELIPERGWTAVSTRLVAERAEVAPGLVHYHFSSVQALLREAALGSIRGLTGQLAVLLDAAAGPAEAIDLLFGSLNDYEGQDPVSLLFCEAYLAASRDEELRRSLAKLIEDARDELGGWLAARGVPDAAAIAAVLAAAIDGVALHRTLGAHPPAPGAAAVLGRLVSEPTAANQPTPATKPPPANQPTPGTGTGARPRAR